MSPATQPETTTAAHPDARARAADPEVLVEAVAVGRTYHRGARRGRADRPGDGAVVAVAGVSVAVRAGMRVALTGPSGSGKSTLLHVLAGLEEPTSGALTWPGLGGPPRGRPGTVGVVLQGPSLVPALDVLENVALPQLLADLGEDAAVNRAAAALDRLGLGGLARQLPGELSGGQAQRVALARVLAARPRLILADEPTGQLDHATAARVMAVLLETTAEIGAALVVSTHDAAVARALPLRWRMRDGRLLDEEPGVNGAERDDGEGTGRS